jgi:hypothetical protein
MIFAVTSSFQQETSLRNIQIKDTDNQTSFADRHHTVWGATSVRSSPEQMHTELYHQAEYTTTLKPQRPSSRQPRLHLVSFHAVAQAPVIYGTQPLLVMVIRIEIMVRVCHVPTRQQYGWTGRQRDGKRTRSA